MQREQSHLREARLDTLAHRAPDDLIDSLSGLYALSAPHIPRDSQREFNHASVYSVRGSYTHLISALSAIFDHLTEEAAGATLTPAAAPYLTSPDISANWGDERLISFNGNLYQSISYDSGTSRLYLSPALSLGITPAPRSGSPTTATAQLLPFTISEPQPDSLLGAQVSARCEVIVDIISSQLDLVPPSYLRDLASARTSDPPGAHILNIYSATESERIGDQSTGPYPLYFPSLDFDRETRALFDSLLASGVRLSMRIRRTYS